MEVPEDIRRMTPNLDRVRQDFSRLIDNFESLDRLIFSPELSFRNFHENVHSITMSLIPISFKVKLLTLTDKKYKKLVKELHEIEGNLIFDLERVERKIYGNSLLFESRLKEKKSRRDLSKFFNKVKKQVKQVQKKV